LDESHALGDIDPNQEIVAQYCDTPCAKNKTIGERKSVIARLI
jgi:hypothetical protein